MAEPVGDPDVALAVDAKTAIVNPGLEVFGLARISGGEARDVVGTAIGYPNPVLLVDGEVKWSPERLARLLLIAFANDPTLADLALGKVDELAFLDAENPDVSARRDDYTLHQPEPAIESDAFRRRQRLTVLVKYRDGFAPVSCEPGIVVCVDGCSEGAALHPAPGKACGYRRERTPVRSELGGVALPQHVIPLPTDREIIADPKIALAIEHGLAARAIAAAVELEWQNPSAGRVVEVRHEWNRAKVLALRYGIELIQQRKESIGPVPRVAGDRLRGYKRVARGGALRSRCRREELAASVGRHLRHATRKDVGQRSEVGHCWRLPAVERALDRFSPRAAFEIDEVRYVSCSDAQAKFVSF